MEPLPKLLTPQDVAMWLSLPTARVVRLARRGLIPSFTLPCGDLMFDQAVLGRWLDKVRPPGTKQVDIGPVTKEVVQQVNASPPVDSPKESDDQAGGNL